MKTKTAVDLADSIGFVAKHGIVSGIQRVVIESWRELSKHPELEASPVAYFATRQGFIEIDPSDVDNLIELLRSGNNVEAAKALASKICKRFESNSRHVFTESEVLLSMGATWAEPMYFNAVSQVKREGAAVVNLVYDLIPGFDHSFPYGTREAFQIYISEVARVSERVPCISAATRNDFVEFAEKYELPCPPGGSTGLPGGFGEDQISKESFLSEQISRKFNLQAYVLIVGTIESRKEHIVALKAWSELAKTYEISDLPDLVCVGRWGWNVRELIDEWNLNLVIKTKIHFLTENVTDSDLTYLYKHCLFTVYPSRMEGWGLPVTESLDFGKVVVTTNISSLPEAGEGLALLFESGNHKELSSICEKLIFDGAYRSEIESAIATNRNSKTWKTFADSIVFEVEQANKNRLLHNQISPEFGREYGLMSMSDLAVSHSAKEYLAALAIRRELPLTSQVATLRHHAEALLMVGGSISRLTNFGALIASGDNSRFELAFKVPKGCAVTALLSFYVRRCAEGSITAKLEDGGPIDLTDRNTLRFDLLTSNDNLTEISLDLDIPKNGEFYIASLMFLDTDEKEFEIKVSNAIKNQKNYRNHFQLRTLPIGEAEFLKASSSWKISAPFRAVHKYLLKFLKK